MPLLMQRMALLAKRETTYGVDAAPTGAANAIQALNVQITPLVMLREARQLAKTYLGNDQVIVGGFYGQMAFEVEAAGSGLAGTAPAYGPLHRACGFAEALSAGVSATYTPVSFGFDSVTLWGHIDGVVHKIVGCRGELGFRGNYRSATMWTYDFQGIFVPVADAALPTAVLTAFQKPLAFNKANSPTFTVHGTSGIILRNLGWAMNNQVAYRNLVNSEAVRITGRAPTHSLDMGAELMATKNWFNTTLQGTTGAIQLIHGTTAGNIIEMNMPAASIEEARYSDFEGDAYLNTSGKLMAGASGNDEISIVVR